MKERRAIIEISTGKVVNMIVYDDTKPWNVADGFLLLSESNSLTASIYDTWDGEKIIKQIPQIPEVIIDTTPIVSFGASVIDAVNKNKKSYASLSSAERINVIGKILGLE